MNYVARPPKPATAAAPAVDSGISGKERLRRKAGVDYARASVRLEGLIVPPYAEDLYGRYIAGEINLKELGEKIMACAKL